MYSLDGAFILNTLLNSNNEITDRDQVWILSEAVPLWLTRYV